MRLYTILLFALGASAQIHIPHVGIARFGDGTVRRVAGVSGSLTSSQPLMDGALRVGGSDQLAVAKLARSVRVFDASGSVLYESPAPDGGAVIGFSRDGAQALVYFSSGPSLAICSPAACDDVEATPPAGVRAVALASREA